MDCNYNDNNTYFTDGKHTYHFSVSKNTLYMIFDDLELLDFFEVGIMDDPYMFLLSLTQRISSDKLPVDFVHEQGNVVETYQTAIEKRFSTYLPLNEINNIPQLAYQVGEMQTREFVVLIDGVVKNLNSIKEFKWIIK